MNEETAKITGGATIWARQTTDSQIFYEKPDKWFKIWFYLVNRVNHKPVKKWNRGECFIIYTEIEQATGATKDQVKKCLQYLSKMKMIDTARSTRGVNLKILNYSHYQDLDNYKNGEQSTTGSTRKALEKHQRSTTINKNDNNDNNISNLKVAGVDDILKIFYRINPTLNWGNKTTRKAAEDLIKRFGLDETKRMAEAVIDIQGTPYAPVATTPYQMKEKLAQFKIYFDSKNKTKKQGTW